MSSAKVVTRIAPSPTGHMHIGTVRTALFNYLFAKKHGGEFLVRIEDTDQARSKSEWVEAIWKDFEWVGLTPDRRYTQSEHRARHQKLLERLVSEGKAYLSKESSRDDPGKETEVVRFKNPGVQITFSDLVRGEVSFDTTELGDFVIARSITDPLYHFAVVVDDADEGVTHVIRAEEHLSNTPRQILLIEAFGFSRPQYAHIPLILASDRTKLSKRHGAVSINEYRAQGFIPEALLNYLALLGWNPGDDREIFSLQELIKEFSIERIHKGGAIFNIEKLQWFNHEHLKQLSNEEYVARFKAFSGEEISEAVAALLKERAKTLGEAKQLLHEGEFEFLGDTVECSADLLVKGAKADAPTVSKHLQAVLAMLSELSESHFSSENVKQAIFPYATEHGRASVLWPLRVALSGKEKSPDPFTIAGLIGREKTLVRIADALKKI